MKKFKKTILVALMALFGASQISASSDKIEEKTNDGSSIRLFESILFGASIGAIVGAAAIAFNSGKSSSPLVSPRTIVWVGTLFGASMGAICEIPEVILIAPGFAVAKFGIDYASYMKKDIEWRSMLRDVAGDFDIQGFTQNDALWAMGKSAALTGLAAGVGYIALKLLGIQFSGKKEEKKDEK